MKNKSSKIIFVVVAIAVAAALVYACCNKPKIIGGDKDAHGCLIAAGYSWCDTKQECLRLWEEPCESIITYSEAYNIAENSTCIEKGSLLDNRVYNNYTRTWWIDMEMKPEFKQENCNPACVISEDTKTAEINWRCTGLLLQ